MSLIFGVFFTEKRQTVLFSATQTRNVEDLARVSLKKAPLYVGVDDHKDTSTVDGLEQVAHVYIHVYTLYNTNWLDDLVPVLLGIAW